MMVPMTGSRLLRAQRLPQALPRRTRRSARRSKRRSSGANKFIKTILAAPGDMTGYLASKITGNDSYRGAGTRAASWGMGAIGADPAAHPPQSELERLLQAGGEGAASMVLPEAGLAGLTIRGGLAAVVPKTADLLTTALGSGSARSFAVNAGVGAGQASFGQGVGDATNNPLLGAAASLMLPVGVMGAVGAYRRLAPALSEAAATTAAANKVYGSFETPAGTRSAILADNGSQILPRSNPTSFQRYGDTGLGDIERQVQTNDPRAFVSNEYGTGTEQQNQVQAGVLAGLNGTGDPLAVADAFRAQKQQIEDFHDQLADAAVQNAQDQTDALGGGKYATGPAIKNAIDPLYNADLGQAQGAASALGGADLPSDQGAAMRSSLTSALAPVQKNIGDLYGALPRDLTTSIVPVRDMSQQLYGNVGPAKLATVSPAETSVLDVLKQYGNTVPLNEAQDLDTLITTKMREMKSGPSPNLQAYGRLSQLKGAWEDAFHGSVQNQVAADNQAVSSGARSPQDTTASRLQALQGQQAGFSPATGSSVFTPSGRRIGVQYGVADASDLTASHLPDMRPNPDFPANLQPRDRSRAASDAQIADIASNLQPERLGASASAAEGAPIVGPDGIVESGNGRVLAIQRAHAQGGPQSAAYRDFLASQGYDTTGMKAPVLIRRRTSDLTPDDRIRFAQEANASPVLTQSATERAAADAARLSDSALAKYGGGDISSADNRPFVRSFLRDVAEKGEQGRFAAPDGALSLDGARRVQNALLHAGYGDHHLVQAMAETGDPDIAAFGKVMGDSAGRMAQLRRGIAAGDVHPGADVSAPVLEAGRVVQNARAKGLRLPDAVAQADAFNPISAEAHHVLEAAYGPNLNGRLSRVRMGEILNAALDDARQQTTDARLFGEQPLTAGQILKNAQARYGAGSETAGSISYGSRDTGAGNGEGRPGARGPRLDAAGAGRPDAGVLGRPDSAPTVTQAEIDGYRAAKDAHIDMVDRFRKGSVGKFLQSDGTAGSYKLGDHAGPDLFVPKGPSGYQAVQSYKAAVGGDEAATGALHNAFSAKLRDAALNGDGTIDPARYQRFQKDYGPALAAAPELRGRFDTAANARAALDRYGRYSPGTEPYNTPSLFFPPGAAGAEGVNHLRSLIGDARANDILSDHAASLLKGDGGGPVDQARVDKFNAKYGPAMREFPDLGSRFATAADAQKTIGDAAAMRKATLQNFQNGAARRFLNLNDGSEVRDTIGSMFQKNNVSGLRQLMAAVRSDPAAEAGVKQAAADYMNDFMLSPTTEGCASGVKQVNQGTYQNLLNKSRGALAEVFDDRQMQNLDALSGALRQHNRSVTGIRQKGSPNTAADLLRATRDQSKEGGNWIRRLVEGAVAGRELGGEEHGAWIGATLGAGKALKDAIATAGLGRTSDIIKQAILDPELMKALMQKVSIAPDRGTQVTLANSLKRYNMFRTIYKGVNNQDDLGRKPANLPAYARGGRIGSQPESPVLDAGALMDEVQRSSAADRAQRQSLDNALTIARRARAGARVALAGCSARVVAKMGDWRQRGSEALRCSTRRAVENCR